MSYASYINVPALLSSQKPMTAVDDHLTWGAERFFIVCHQTSELWASQILSDVEQATARCGTPAAWRDVCALLTRAAGMALMLSRTIEQLVYLPKDQFLRFRVALQGTSASQSGQFQQLLRIAEGRHPHVNGITAALETGPGDQPGDPERRESHALRRACAEASSTLVRALVIWRRLHLEIARHFIDDRPGTGGTSGIDHLLRELRGCCDAENCVSPLSVSLAELLTEIDALERQTRSLRVPEATQALVAGEVQPA